MHSRPRCVWGEDIKKQCSGKSTTPKGVASSLASLPRVGCVALANPALSKVQPRWGRGTPRGLELSNLQYGGVWTHRVVGVGYRMYNVMR